MGTDATTPDTIVLIHGFWVTPRSWEHWIDRYEQAGYRVIAPAYPGFEVEVEALNADTSPIEALTVPAVVEHLEAVVGELESPPILIGHSAGGAFVQLLLDHGFGAVGVAINSAPTEGVRVTPPAAQVAVPRAQEPGQPPPRRRLHARAVALRVHEHLRRRGVSALYERYHIPASGAILWGIVLANVEPGHQAAWVDYKNDNRAPLLFISGSEDHLMPPSVQRSNAKHYKSNTITEVKEYEGKAHPPPRPGGLGRGRRLRSGLGARQRDPAGRDSRRSRVTRPGS